jgi:hypothetical protein
LDIAQLQRTELAPGSGGESSTVAFWSSFIHPFEPVIDRDDSSMRPDGTKEWAVRDFLYPSIDGGCTIFRPMGPPSSADHVCMQKSFLLVKERKLCCGSCVVAFERQIPDVVDERVGHAQCGNEVVNAAVLRESSEHCPPAYLIFPTKIDRKPFRKLTVYSYSSGSRAS